MLEGGLKYSVLLHAPRETLRKEWNRPSYTVPVALAALGCALVLGLGFVRPKN
jgi:hypothetical protein